ncbi:transcriptional regulator [Actinosynnema sp. NPDC023658]|uniref:transcriptional regulator n=1 Tax=Actinosynnema sp. NPDC023658 TaxID=3155465 RepID=UPI0033E40A9A
MFTKAARLAGFRSTYALAKAMDVNRSTVARVLAGEMQPGPAFIAGALLALAPMQFHDLFTIASDQRRNPAEVNRVPQAQDR